MNRLTLLECLCPHCHSATGFNENVIIDPKMPSTIHCSECFSPFEILVVNGVGQTKNVIVVAE